ncbi:MAG: peptidylprolyl isomerase [Pseudomonadota bacterium]
MTHTTPSQAPGPEVWRGFRRALTAIGLLLGIAVLTAPAASAHDLDVEHYHVAQSEDQAEGEAEETAAEESGEEAVEETVEETTEAPAAEATEETAEAEAAPETPPSPQDTVATVNGVDIKLGEVLVLFEDLPEQYRQLPDEILSRGLVEQLVDQYLLSEAARAAGIGEQTRTSFTVLNRTRSALAEGYLRAELDKRVTDIAVRERFEADLAATERVAEVRASHILVSEEEKAQELRAALDDGADFAELAGEHGTDGTAQRGGDLGFFAYGDMVPEFAEAAFALEVDEVGGPIQSAFGWHLIKVFEKRDRPLPTFEEVEGQIRQQMFQEAQREIIGGVREAASVELADPPMAPSAIRDTGLLDLPAGE